MIVTMTTNNAPSFSAGCKMGDAVRVERVDYSRYTGIWAPEIAVIGIQGRYYVY